VAPPRPTSSPISRKSPPPCRCSPTNPTRSRPDTNRTPARSPRPHADHAQEGLPWPSPPPTTRPSNRRARACVPLDNRVRTRSLTVLSTAAAVCITGNATRAVLHSTALPAVAATGLEGKCCDLGVRHVQPFISSRTWALTESARP
jgi:hypothetical protein